MAQSTAGTTAMSMTDFLAAIDDINGRIGRSANLLNEVSLSFDQSLNGPTQTASRRREQLMTEAQSHHAAAVADVKRLARDASLDSSGPKAAHVRRLKAMCEHQLAQYKVEDARQRHSLQLQIARDYRTVNPEASEADVQAAATADWGEHGVFESALKSNRTNLAASTLGSVRARHNDIQRIERSIEDLNRLFQDLASAVVLQDQAVQDAEKDAGQAFEDVSLGNQHLSKGVDSARRARKLKWICFWLVIVAILIIIAVVVGVVCGEGLCHSRN